MTDDGLLHPVLTPSGEPVFPRGWAGQLLGALVLHADLCRGVQRPASAPRPRWTRELAESAVVLAEVVRRDSAGGSSAGSAGTASTAQFGDAVPVSEAAVMLGCSARRIRYLLAGYKLQGQKAGATWLVYRDSITRRVDDLGKGT